MAQIRDVDNGLLFGNYFWELDGVLKSSGKQAYLMLNDGCVAAAAHTIECQNFHVRVDVAARAVDKVQAFTVMSVGVAQGGLLLNGLHSTLKEYRRRGRNLLLHRMAATNETFQGHASLLQADGRSVRCVRDWRVFPRRFTCAASQWTCKTLCHFWRR